MPQNFIKFYGNDWRSDPELRLCEPISRAVWIDLLTFMMEAEPFGHLLINGKVPSAETIGALTVTPPKVVKRALADLEANGVFSKTDQGVIYSRRMLKDAARTAELRDRGSRGGNPALVKPLDKPKDNPSLKPEDKPEVKPVALTHARLPEARSQKPDSPLPPEVNGTKAATVARSVNGHAKPPPPEADDTLPIVRSFHALKEKIWGITAPPDDRLTARELSVAKAWVEDGVEYYPALDFMNRRMTEMRSRGQLPPERPQFFDKQIREAMQADWPGFKP